MIKTLFSAALACTAVVAVLPSPAFAGASNISGASTNDAALIARGQYLARVGDCAACHTAKDGKPFAGGLPLGTPLGVIYSTNITPDAHTGIGSYSYEDFDRALRRGIAKDGHTLYPAMPYPSYAHVKPEDVKALYAYFSHGVAPVDQPARANTIPWPLSMRWPLALWRRAFAPTVAGGASEKVGGTASATGSADDALIARGRYLVEGLGHCSACHTSRGALLEEHALTDREGPAFLSGGVVEQWLANDLRADNIEGLGQWSRADIVAFLKSGRNEHSAAFGGMRDVVLDSTQHLDERDLEAMAAYLHSLAPAQGARPAPAYSESVAHALRQGRTTLPGARTFLDNCAACHRSDGKGYAGVFPRLALSPTVNSADPTSLIHLVLHGASIPATASAPTSFTMPGFAERLTDEQVADVVSFIRSSWGNRAGKVSPNDVSRVRKATAAR